MHVCVPCSLFGKAGDAKSFVWRSVTNWTTFNNKVKAHSTCPTHIKCASEMVIASWRSSKAISLQLMQQSSSGIITSQLQMTQCYYRFYYFMWQQNNSLRGHGDANCSLHNATNNNNFKAVIEFRASCNPVLRQHHEHGQKNAQHTDEQIHEAFLGFFELKEATAGRSITSVIETVLATFHLDAKKMRGQE